MSALQCSALGYNEDVEIEVRELVWDVWNREHVRGHTVEPTEVDQICLGHRRGSTGQHGRVRVVGRASAGRIVVAILDPLGEGRFYCVTAFPATGRTRREFLERQQRGEA